MKKLLHLLIVLSVICYASNSFAQGRNSKFEISCFGAFSFNLVNEDLAVAPDKSYTNYGWEYLRLAYHTNPEEVFSSWLCLKLGASTVVRGISSNFVFKYTPDDVSHQEIYAGTNLNPFHSSKMWFHFAAGLNRLHIDGLEDIEAGRGPGITFVGNNIWNKFINNLQAPNGIIKGYPDYNRFSAALNVGVNLRIWGVFALYLDYTPVLVTPIRNDISAGLTFIFASK